MKKIIFLFLIFYDAKTNECFGQDYEIIKTTIDQEKNNWFMPEKSGWLSGDAAHSIPLDNKRILWIFGDTWTGKYEDGVLKPDDWFVNNSIAIQYLNSTNKDSIDFIFGSEDEGRAFFPNEKNMPGEYLWPTNGFILKNSLFIFCQAVAADKNGWFGIAGTVIVGVDNFFDHPKKWDKKYYDFETPPWSDEFQLLYHSALYVDNDYIYFMGFTLDNGVKKSILSRMLKNKFLVFKNSKHLEHLVWEDRRRTWSSSNENRIYLFKPGNTESNIQYIPEWDVFVTTTYTAIDNKILLSFSDRLYGPWSEPQIVFENPMINCPDKICIETYAVRCHPEFSQRVGELIISYVTSYTGDYKNANILAYRPRFIKVQIGQKNNH